MIKELPLLPEDWSQWDWLESNYNATKEQTRKSYYALSNGLCSDFAKEVWNDLVDLLALTLETAGLEWDTTYGTSAKCRITDALGALTAKAFNAVALNLNQLGTFRWKWEASGASGYLGRKLVRGYTEYGKQSDYVYGWYIKELATRYNQLVSILNNTADFTEFVSQDSSKSAVHAATVVLKSAPMKSTGTSKSIEYADLRPVPAAHLQGHVVSASKKHASLTIARSAPLDSRTISQSSGYADLQAKIAARMSAHAASNTNVHAKLSELIYAARLQFKGSSKTSAYADVSFYKCAEILGRVLLGSIAHSALSAVPSCQLTAHTTSGSSVNALLSTPAPVALQADTTSISRGWAGMVLSDPMGAASQTKSKSLVRAGVDLSRPDLMYARLRSQSKASGEVVIREPYPVDANARSFSGSHTELTTAESEPLESTVSSQSVSHTELAAVKPIRFEAAAYSGVTSEAALTVGRPMALGVKALIRSMASADLERLLPKSVVSYATVGSTVDASMLRKAARRLAAQAVSRTSVYAELTFYQAEPEEDWYDPVQDGGDLYIRNAYPQWQENSNIHLDSGTFYEPEQSESNIYIRSVDSLKGV